MEFHGGTSVARKGFEDKKMRARAVGRKLEFEY
jgi:hypothetical protein